MRSLIGSALLLAVLGVPLGGVLGQTNTPEVVRQTSTEVNQAEANASQVEISPALTQEQIAILGRPVIPPFNAEQLDSTRLQGTGAFKDLPVTQIMLNTITSSARTLSVGATNSLVGASLAADALMGILGPHASADNRPPFDPNVYRQQAEVATTKLSETENTYVTQRNTLKVADAKARQAERASELAAHQVGGADYQAGADKLSAAKTDHDGAEALKSFFTAAKQGNAHAQFVVGQFYLSGAGGITKSTSMAYVWTDLAARGGDSEARALLGSMREGLSPEELDQANALVQSFHR